MKRVYILLCLFSGSFFTSCDDCIDDFGGLWSIVGIVLLATILSAAIQSSKRAEEKKMEKESARRKRQNDEAMARIERMSKQEAYETDLIAIELEYGVADKTITLAEYDMDREIRVYLSSGKIFITGEIYNLAQILSCSLVDNATVKKGETKITTTGQTKASTGGVIGRGLVGGFIAGPAGAVIGGTTGKKNTTSTSIVSQGDDTTIHDYTVWITVRDITRPLIEIHVGEDVRKANEITALINAITAANNE